MSFREEAGGGGDGRDLQKPFLHTGSWYKMNSRQSSVMGSTTQIMRDGSVSVLFCVLIAALGPIQFGFTVCFNSIHSQFCLIHRENNQLLIFNFLFFMCGKCGYSSPTQQAIIKDLNLTVSEVYFYFILWFMI
jgi:SP family facilitated glucose transporter-like MFS transporter 8